MAFLDFFKKKNDNLIIESKTNVDDLLPIGSVVTIPDLNHRMMIIGIKQISVEDNHEYDYAGVPNPSGILGNEGYLLFNNDDITEINFIGYQDSERFAFLDQLQEYMNKRC